jgi:hypothetical protein
MYSVHELNGSKLRISSQNDFAHHGTFHDADQPKRTRARGHSIHGLNGGQTAAGSIFECQLPCEYLITG